MKRLAVAALSLLLPAAAALAEESAALLDTPDDWHQRVAAVLAANAEPAGPPLTAPLVACSGTACAHQSLIALNEAEAEQVRGLFDLAATADAERRAIGRAIARFETFVGERNGTWADAPGNRHVDYDEPDQLDCVSETANTHTYLERLARAGLLVHHRLGRMVTRYTLFLQHVAQTMLDDDEEYVVDSWVGASGEEPEILPYADWRSEWAV